MFRANKRVARIVLTLVVLAMLAAPFTASAGYGSTSWGLMIVWPFSSQTYTLNVSGIAVTVPSGALPYGGIVVEKVRVQPDGQFTVDFYPDYVFAKSVMMDFRSVETVYFHDDAGVVAIPTYDLDGNGEAGEFYSDHFSRYSGWF